MNNSYLNLIPSLINTYHLHQNTDIFSNKWYIDDIHLNYKHKKKGVYELKLMKRLHPKTVRFADNINIQEVKNNDIITYNDHMNKYGHYSKTDRELYGLILKLLNKKIQIINPLEFPKILGKDKYNRLVTILINLFSKLQTHENKVIYSHNVILYPRHLILIKNILINDTDIRNRINIIMKHYRNYKSKNE